MKPPLVQGLVLPFEHSYEIVVRLGRRMNAATSVAPKNMKAVHKASTSYHKISASDRGCHDCAPVRPGSGGAFFTRHG
jgi:hypothetical protein